MYDYESKRKILDDIEKHVTIFERKSPIEFRIRCPICGDSQKDPRDSHCYIKCSYDPTEPLKYNCFLCNSGGKVNTFFLSKIGCSKKSISTVKNQIYNVLPSLKDNPVDIITGSPNMDSMQVKYIDHRLGPGLTFEDYDRLKIVWDMSLVVPYITRARERNSLPSNNDSITFVSDDKMMLLTRTFLDSSEEHQWRKIPIMKNSNDNKSFYVIKSTFNLFTSDTIYVNIAEGIFDIISVYKNFNTSDSSIFIATLGSNYVSAVEYAIQKGVVGSNVVVNIYIDNNIDMDFLSKILKPYKWLFKSIYIYMNLRGKDVGIRLDQIKLTKSKV